MTIKINSLVAGGVYTTFSALIIKSFDVNNCHHLGTLESIAGLSQFVSSDHADDCNALVLIYLKKTMHRTRAYTAKKCVATYDFLHKGKLVRFTGFDVMCGLMQRI